VEGASLHQIKNQLPQKALKHIWKQVGKELKKIHSISIMNQSDIEKDKADLCVK